MLLAESVIIVTGASRGIGRATARLLSERGATVVCSARDATAVQAVAAEVGGTPVVADLLQEGSAEALVAAAIAEHGRIDGVVANAGAGYAGDFSGMTSTQVAELVKLDFEAPMQLALAALPAMRTSPRRESGGQGLVFVSSIAGAVGVPEEAVYSAAKAGLDAFAVLLREQLRAESIAVSAIVPGVVATDFFSTRGAPYTRRFPRPMPPERVAAAVVRALETGAPRLFVPRWLAVPAWLAAAVPRPYRALARRFG